MNRRIKLVIAIEILIVLGLLIHMVRSPHFLIVVAFALLFTFLARSSRVRFFQIVSTVCWAVSALVLMTAGWFWLALLFPIIALIIFWSKHPREAQSRPFQGPFNQSILADDNEEIRRTNGNDVIDLQDFHFKPAGNSLSIKKATGNTKIIVPADVAVALAIQVETGVVKIYDEMTKINAGEVRYFTDEAENFEKRIRIEIRVETGNVEIVHG